MYSPSRLRDSSRVGTMSLVHRFSNKFRDWNSTMKFEFLLILRFIRFLVGNKMISVSTQRLSAGDSHKSSRGALSRIEMNVSLTDTPPHMGQNRLRIPTSNHAIFWNLQPPSKFLLIEANHLCNFRKFSSESLLLHEANRLSPSCVTSIAA